MGDGWTRHFDELTQAWYFHNTETGERKWDENSDEDNAGEGAAEEEAAVVVDEWRKVYVVRYEGGGPVFKHWALYVIDKKDDHTGFLCHLEGSRENYRYKCKRTKNPRSSRKFVDMHQVGYVDTNYLKEFRDFAKAKIIQNEDPYWGCQDWTWEISDELADEGLLEHREEFEEETAELESLKGPG
jgi:hypothetical protein